MNGIRKAVIIFIIMLASTPVFSAHMEIAPYGGAYGIPMGNEYYTGGDYDNPDDPSTPDGWGDRPYFDDATEYSNNEIIAIAGLQDLYVNDYLDRYQDTELKITVTCPNGFYFVSQSNPAFKRPFEIQLVYTDWIETDCSIIHGRPGQNKNYQKTTIREGSPTATMKIDNLDTIEDHKTETGSWTPHYAEDYLNFWADIVLVLPGEMIDGTDTLVAPDSRGVKREYPLIEAEDYTALVTITVEYGDIKRDTITIPFSGFYKRGQTKKNDDVCSLLVTPTSQAAHMSITRDRGTWVDVASLEFMMSTFGSDKHSPIIFASSSPNPEVASKDFRLVHSSVTYDTPLTNTNSIGYDVRITGIDGENNRKTKTFQGSDSISSVVNSEVGIEPALSEAKMTHASDTMNFYRYGGNVEVMLDPGDNVMLQGRYDGTVYIHVVADDPSGGA